MKTKTKEIEEGLKEKRSFIYDFLNQLNENRDIVSAFFYQDRMNEINSELLDLDSQLAKLQKKFIYAIEHE